MARSTNNATARVLNEFPRFCVESISNVQNLTTMMQTSIARYVSMGNINQRINAKSNRNALNINYLLATVIHDLERNRAAFAADTSKPTFYSRSSSSWKLYHK